MYYSPHPECVQIRGGERVSMHPFCHVESSTPVPAASSCTVLVYSGEAHRIVAYTRQTECMSTMQMLAACWTKPSYWCRAQNCGGQLHRAFCPSRHSVPLLLQRRRGEQLAPATTGPPGVLSPRLRRDAFACAHLSQQIASRFQLDVTYEESDRCDVWPASIYTVVSPTVLLTRVDSAWTCHECIRQLSAVLLKLLPSGRWLKCANVHAGIETTAGVQMHCRCATVTAVPATHWLAFDVVHPSERSTLGCRRQRRTSGSGLTREDLVAWPACCPPDHTKQPGARGPADTQIL